jgi:hypothetical protein
MSEKIDETMGFVSTILNIISNPVQNTLKIALDTSFNHRGFLSKCIAIYVSTGIISKVTITNHIVSAIVSTTGMIVVVFIQIFITYFGLRSFSHIYHSGFDYAKLICIAQGLAFLIIGVIEGALFLFGPNIYIVLLILQFIILVPYWAMVLGRFWELNPILAYIIYLISMLPAAILVIFILWPMMEFSIY